VCADQTTLPSSTPPALMQFKQHDTEWQRAKRESNCSTTSTSAGMITRYHSHVNFLYTALTQNAKWQRAKRESNCSTTSTSAGMITRYHSHVNLLGSSPLNHLSWLRPSTNFLCAALTASTTHWVIFRNGQTSHRRMQATSHYHVREQPSRGGCGIFTCLHQHGPTYPRPRSSLRTGQ
jgi:hypothetical protein